MWLTSSERRCIELILAPVRKLVRRVFGLPTRPCSWCLAEHGLLPKAGDSHGICIFHARSLVAKALVDLDTEREKRLLVVQPVSIAPANKPPGEIWPQWGAE